MIDYRQQFRTSLFDPSQKLSDVDSFLHIANLVGVGLCFSQMMELFTPSEEGNSEATDHIIEQSLETNLPQIYTRMVDYFKNIDNKIGYLLEADKIIFDKTFMLVSLAKQGGSDVLKWNQDLEDLEIHGEIDHGYETRYD